MMSQHFVAMATPVLYTHPINALFLSLCIPTVLTLTLTLGRRNVFLRLKGYVALW